MKKVLFHADQQQVTIFVNGNPVSLYGEVDVTVTEPTKKTRTNKTAWSLVTSENAAAVSVDVVPGV